MLRIATNTKKSFLHIGSHEFLHLDEKVDKASIILLMLEKNWGSGSINKIEYLTYQLSKYPKNIPCYLAGCETTIPNHDLELYRHKERDDAIRNLCDEVLSRSNSIGVRGEITLRYLVEMLGYDKSKVDVIYLPGENNNLEKIDNFLIKNDCPTDLTKSILDFQIKPYHSSDQEITFEKRVVISKPSIILINETARLSADIRIDGKIKTLWLETNKKFADYLLYERSDAFLCALLPFAMRNGKDIVCDAPVSEQFLHNLTEILIPQLSTYDWRLYCTKIIASSDASKLINGNAVSTAMSCGVDSFYTVNLYKNSKFSSMNLTHLYCGNYLYGNDGPIYERAELVAKELDLPLICTATNINEAFDLPHLYTHFFKTMFGVLSLKKLFRIYYYSTTEDFSHFNLYDNSIRDTAEIELLLIYVFSTSDFQIISGGVKNERLEKTRNILNLESSYNFLNVCLYPEKQINCGVCEKCRRTLLTLDMLNSLDLFRNVFNVDEYLLNRLDNFVFLLNRKDSVMLSDVYKYFLKTEPRLIAEAQAVLDKPNINITKN